MSNMTRTVLDYGSIVLKSGNIQPFTLTASSEVTYKRGSILARDSSTGLLVEYVKGGTTNGNGVPITVLSEETTVTAEEVTAGTCKVSCFTEATLRQDRLVIIADGDASNVDYIELDGLRNMNIDVSKVTDQSVLDN
ncbi:hypothetical protein vBVhaSMAG7_069 [Vibrio phage vB_VhaS_MAG7]|nr:hypothetical protein vBVhaSMAG7_069 [Vibrio phage vB_VhaS_MAG7]